MAYINNNRDRLQEDVRQLQQRLRYRNADAVDCLELSLALERLNEKEIVALDEERKAAMVSNLLVVLCGNKDAQPIVNSGSLY